MNIERFLAGVSGRLVPIVAPIFTAYSVWLAILSMGRPAWVALAGAVAIEAMGFAAVDLALTLHSYNASRGDDDPRAPFELAVVLVFGYVFVALLITAALEIFPALGAWVAFAFPLLSMAGAAVLALKSDHSRRLVAILARDDEVKRAAETRLQERRDRAAEKKRVRSGGGQSAGGNGSGNGQAKGGNGAEIGQDGGLDAANAVRKLSRSEAMTALVEFYRVQPGASYSVAARNVDRSKSWVVAAVPVLVRAGRLKKNGRGMEVAS